MRNSFHANIYKILQIQFKLLLIFQITIKIHSEFLQNTRLINLKDYFKQSLHIEKDYVLVQVYMIQSGTY